MSFYGPNRFSSVNDIDVEEATGYEGVTGAGIALLEAYQNDFNLFKGTIMCDFQETAAICEGASESDIVALQENFVTSMWEKLKAFFKKLWAKIKSIFHAFVAKFDSVVMKSNKEFFKKYYSEVYNKNLTDMTAKYSKPKGLAITDNTLEINTGIDELKSGSADAYDKAIQDYDRDEVFEKYAKTMTGLNTDAKDFAKDFHEACFEDESEETGFGNIIRECGNMLQSGDKELSELKKAQSKVEHAIAGIIKDIEKDQRESGGNNYPTDEKEENKPTSKLNRKEYSIGTNSYKTGDYGQSYVKGKANKKAATSPKVYQRYLTLLHNNATIAQEVISKVTAACITEVKFGIAQSRRIFAKAVAYNDKKEHNEATDLFAEAFAEAEEYDILTDMD